MLHLYTGNQFVRGLQRNVVATSILLFCLLTNSILSAQDSVSSLFEIYQKAMKSSESSSGWSDNSASEGFFGLSGLLSGDPVTTAAKGLIDKVKNQVVVVSSYEGDGGQYTRHEGAVTSLALSMQGDAVLSGSVDKTAQLWILKDKRTVKTYQDEFNHKQGVTDVAFSPDNRFVLTASYDTSIRLWNSRNGKNVKAFNGSKDRVWAIAVPRSGAYVAGACNDGQVYFWNASTIKRLGTISAHSGPVFGLDISLDEKYMVTAGADNLAKVWDLKSKNSIAEISGHSDKVYSAVFSPNGEMVLTASRDKTARLWNRSNGEEVCRFVGHVGAVRKAIFIGSFIITASDDGTIRIWSPNRPGQGPGAGGMEGMATDSQADQSRSEAAYLMGMQNPTGMTVEKVREKLTRPLGKTKGIELVRFEGPESAVLDVIFSLDGRSIIGAYLDGVVRIWKMPALPGGMEGGMGSMGGGLGGPMGGSMGGPMPGQPQP